MDRRKKETERKREARKKFKTTTEKDSVCFIYYLNTESNFGNKLNRKLKLFKNNIFLLILFKCGSFLLYNTLKKNLTCQKKKTNVYQGTSYYTCPLKVQKRKVFYLIFQGQSSETKDIPVWYEAYFKRQKATRMQRLRSQSEFRDKERLQDANYNTGA